MATLTGQSIANSYKDLLQVSNSNSGIDSTSRLVSDGEGTNSILYLSTGRVGIGKSPQTKFEVNLDTNKNLNFSASYMGSIAGILGRNDANDAMADLGLAGSTIQFSADGTNNVMKLDANSRISLSNNDSGADNTIFGFLAGASIGSGHDRNTLIGDYAGNSVQGDSNTIIGRSAGKAITVSNNTIVGDSALSVATTATENVVMGGDAMSGVPASVALTGAVAIGQKALKGSSSTTTGANYSVAVGYESLESVTTAQHSTAVGYQSLNNLSSGNYNTAVGSQALGLASNTASANTAIGYQSGLDITSGGSNTLIGSSSGINLSTGSNNVAIGDTALFTATDSANIVAIGIYAGDAINNSAANGTVAVGRSSLSALTNGGNCTAVGYQSLEDNVSGYNNTAVGYQSLANATGGGNSSVGSQAGDLITSGTNNTLLGSASEVSANSATNQTVIGQGATGQADNSVTLGNASVTDVYMAQDSQAIVHAQNVPNHVANTMSSPYYRFDDSNDHIQILADGSSTFNTQHFTIEAMVYIDTMATHGDPVIIWSFDNTSHSGGYYAQHLRVDQNGEMHLFYNNGGTVGGLSLTTATYNPYFDKWAHVVATYTSGSQKIYINGIEVGSGTTTGTITYYAQEVWINKANYANGKSAQFSRVRFFNNVLNATEVKELYSGASVPYKYKGANQTDLVTSNWANSSSGSAQYDTVDTISANGFRAIETGGNTDARVTSADEVVLVAGKRYRASFNATLTSGASPDWNIRLSHLSGAYVPNAQGKSVGAGLNTFEFTPDTSETYQTYFHTNGNTNYTIADFEIVPIGAVAEFDGSGIASDKWLDKSGNNLHGTVSGATVENAPSGDDGLVYEEGTWDPVFAQSDSLSNEVPMHAETAGKYVRIGNKVTVTGQAIGNSASGSVAASDTITIKGLPYPIPNEAGNRSATSGIVCFSTTLTAGERIIGYLIQNTSQMNLYVNDDENSPTNIFESQLRFDELTNAGHLIFSATYII